MRAEIYTEVADPSANAGVKSLTLPALDRYAVLSAEIADLVQLPEGTPQGRADGVYRTDGSRENHIFESTVAGPGATGGQYAVGQFRGQECKSYTEDVITVFG